MLSDKLEVLRLQRGQANPPLVSGKNCISPAYFLFCTLSFRTVLLQA